MPIIAAAMQEQADTDPEEDGATEQEGAKLQTRRSTRAVKKVKTFAEEFISSETPTASPGNGDASPHPNISVLVLPGGQSSPLLVPGAFEFVVYGAAIRVGYCRMVFLKRYWTARDTRGNALGCGRPYDSPCLM